LPPYSTRRSDRSQSSSSWPAGGRQGSTQVGGGQTGKAAPALQQGKAIIAAEPSEHLLLSSQPHERIHTHP
jgi:hypothetical protein